MNPTFDSCVKQRVIFENARYRELSYAFKDCSLSDSLQSEGLHILANRAEYEVKIAKKNSEKDFSLENLESLILSTAIPLKVSIASAEGSSRKGAVDIIEEVTLRLHRVEGSNVFELKFSTQGQFANGTQETYLDGYLHYDEVQKKFVQMHLKELSIKDQRAQVNEINLQYKEIDDAENPALSLEINDQECWMLSGTGLLKKVKNGFINYVEEKAVEKKPSTGKSLAGVVTFDLSKEHLSIGQQVTKWPACNASPTGLAVAYGAIFLK